MKTADSRSIMLALRAWLADDDGDQNAQRIAEYVVGRAIAGHFGFFMLLLDVVDGKRRPTAQDEPTFETDCGLVVTDEAFDAERPAEMEKAA
jgi:hypothetical protein